MNNPKQFGAVLVVMALVTASAGVQAGNSNGGQRGNPGMANGAMPVNGQTYGQGTHRRSDSQYQHQYQHQHRSRHGSDNVWSSSPETGAADGPYSDDRRLSQRDFQTWLGQGENATKQPGPAAH